MMVFEIIIIIDINFNLGGGFRGGNSGRGNSLKNHFNVYHSINQLI